MLTLLMLGEHSVSRRCKRRSGTAPRRCSTPSASRTRCGACACSPWQLLVSMATALRQLRYGNECSQWCKACAAWPPAGVGSSLRQLRWSGGVPCGDCCTAGTTTEGPPPPPPWPPPVLTLCHRRSAPCLQHPDQGEFEECGAMNVFFYMQKVRALFYCCSYFSSFRGLPEP